MGQTINVSEPTVIGKVALFDTDRSLGGQDGEAFSSASDAAAAVTFPAGLAERLFTDDPKLSNVYVYSNVVSVERPAGWDGDALATTSGAIRDFFVVYDGNKGPPAE